jgi:hypothetical protein
MKTEVIGQEQHRAIKDGENTLNAVLHRAIP